MKRITVFAALCVGVIVHSVLSVVWGTSGIFAYQYMEKEEKRISANLDLLSEIKSSLTSEIESLQNDPESISVYAHELGYVREGERLIKLADYNILGVNALQRYSIGNPLTMTHLDCLPEWFCKVSGLIAFMLILLVVRIRTREENVDDTSV